MRTRKALLVTTDLGLVIYWTLTAIGAISVGHSEWLTAWNWSFLPLDALAILAGLSWSMLPKDHRWAVPMFALALAFTHAAGLMALSFFLLYGAWDASWWIVNLWLAIVPIGLILGAFPKRAVPGARPTGTSSYKSPEKSNTP